MLRVKPGPSHRRLAPWVLLPRLPSMVLLLLRAAVHEVESLLAEFHANRATYIYVFIATTVLSLMLGYFLGRRVEEMRKQTMVDALTGLYNRLGLNVRLHDEYRRAERFQSPLTLMLIDIDRLKQINDEYGHSVGDQILRGAAQAIKNTLRETDYGARWGGDEFAIVAPNTTEPAAERLGAALADGDTEVCAAGPHRRDGLGRSGHCLSGARLLSDS